MEKNYQIKRENEIKVKSEPRHLPVICKLVFHTTAENCFFYTTAEKEIDEK